MRLINVKTFLERESSIREGKQVDHRAKVLEFGDDETTEYAILSHRWVGKEVSDEPRRRETRFASMMATERFFKAASGLKRTDISGYGATLAASTSEAAQNYPRPSTPYIGGMKAGKYAIRTSTTSPIHGFRLGVIMRGIPISVDGRSGSRVGERYKS